MRETRTFRFRGRNVIQRELGHQFPFSAGPQKITNVICSDGETRTAHCSKKGADTFFSIPARVSVKGKTVAGYVTCETLAGWSTESENDPAVWKFVAYTYRKNGHLLPRGTYPRENIG